MTAPPAPARGRCARAHRRDAVRDVPPCGAV